jgi:tRNA pseudouridine38-40 synthase
VEKEGGLWGRARPQQAQRPAAPTPDKLRGVPTWKLTIEYDGTRYRGWQSQKNTERTVQGMVERAAHELLGADATVGGSGRTDAGVHAIAQVAHLRAKKAISEDEVAWGLNEKLPFDIHVLAVEKAPPRFHARHDAKARTYLYRISRRRTAFGKPYVWWVKDRLDAAAMRNAARLFEGRHDFASFCENPEGQESTVVVVERSEVVDAGDEILFRVTASHFVWKMVRRLTGALVEVGRGNLDQAGIEKLLREKSSAPAKWTAPPSGLFLERVVY